MMIVAALALVSCGDARDVGVALDVVNNAGEWEEIAIVHGYYDDFEGCSDIKRLLENEFNHTLRCRPLS